MITRVPHVCGHVSSGLASASPHSTLRACETCGHWNIHHASRTRAGTLSTDTVVTDPARSVGTWSVKLFPEQWLGAAPSRGHGFTSPWTSTTRHRHNRLHTSHLHWPLSAHERWSRTAGPTRERAPTRKPAIGPDWVRNSWRSGSRTVVGEHTAPTAS